MQTVVAVGVFEKTARSMLGDLKYEELVVDVASNPLQGALIEGTGGLRKIRVARQGGGKSGGARAIYYYHNEDKPVYLITIYAKSAQDNLSDKDKNDFRKLVEELKKY